MSKYYVMSNKNCHVVLTCDQIFVVSYYIKYVKTSWTWKLFPCVFIVLRIFRLVSSHRLSKTRQFLFDITLYLDILEIKIYMGRYVRTFIVV